MFHSLLETLNNLNAESFQNLILHHFHWAALLAFVGGLMDCLTPCSAMATTISVGYTSTIAPGVGRGRIWRLALVFFLGVSLTYMALGATFVAFGSVVQRLLGEYVAVVLFVMGAIFLYLFLVNVNALPVRFVPSFLRQTEVRDLGGRRGSLAGAFLTGIAVALTMGPCAAPILILILGVIATLPLAEMHLGIALMFCFSVAIGLFISTMSFVVARQGFKALGKLGRARGVIGRITNGVTLLIALVLLGAGLYISLYGAGALVGVDKAECPPPEPESLLYTLDNLVAEGEPFNGAAATIVGQPLPNFVWHDAQGGKHELAEYRGRHVFLAFWFRNCANCVAKIGKINAAHCRFDDPQKLVFLSVNSGDEPRDMAWVVKHYHMNYPAISDEMGELIQFLGNPSLPLYLVVDPAGKVVYFGGELPKFEQFYGPVAR